MNFKDECVETTNNKILVFEEKRSKLVILNKNGLQLKKIRIDGCQIKNGLKCDFMLLENDKENYIELKGHDVNHAIKQIKKTIESCSENKTSYCKRSFIICTRSPLSAASIQNLKLLFRRDFNSDLIIKESSYKYKIS